MMDSRVNSVMFNYKNCVSHFNYMDLKQVKFLKSFNFYFYAMKMINVDFTSYINLLYSP